MAEMKRYTVLGSDGLRHQLGVVAVPNEHGDGTTALVGVLCGMSMNLAKESVQEGEHQVVTCVGCMAGESETAKLLRQQNEEAELRCRLAEEMLKVDIDALKWKRLYGEMFTVKGS